MALKQQHKTNKTATNNMKMGLNYDSFLVRNTNREFASFSINWNDEFWKFKQRIYEIHRPTARASKIRRCMFLFLYDYK